MQMVPPLVTHEQNLAPIEQEAPIRYAIGVAPDESTKIPRLTKIVRRTRMPEHGLAYITILHCDAA